jgi:hypothetical protein
MNKELVIARYKEDLIWLDNVPQDWVVTVYSKSDVSPIVVSAVELKYIDNSGGNEAHTYLQHIVNNYNDLADITAFIQAWPFDHDRDLIQRLQEPCEGFAWLSHEMLRNEWDAHPHHSLDTFVGDKVESLHPDWLYCALMHKRPPDFFWFGQGGQYMVTREIIHRKPKAFYQHTIDMILGPFAKYKPWCAMERFWDKFYLDEAY